MAVAFSCRLPNSPVSYQSLKPYQFVFNFFAPSIFPLPHPSPRNNIWLKKNPWFVSEVVPELRQSIKRVLE